MSKLDIDAQYDLAAKIQNLVMFVGLLTDDELEALKEMRGNLRESSSKLSAIAGVITPFEESEHSIDRNRAMIKRIDALVAIHETNIELSEADKKLASSKENREAINKIFGL